MDETGVPRSGRCCRGGAMRGLLEPAILAALGARPGYGYELRASLDESTAGLLAVDPGGLYRVLRRMEDDGLVASSWESGEHGPQRRTYELTEDGFEALRGWIDRLDVRRTVIDAIAAAARTALGDAGSPATPTSHEERA